jgi:hypothetical protein
MGDPFSRVAKLGPCRRHQGEPLHLADGPVVALGMEAAEVVGVIDEAGQHEDARGRRERVDRLQRVEDVVPFANARRRLGSTPSRRGALAPRIRTRQDPVAQVLVEPLHVADVARAQKGVAEPAQVRVAIDPPRPLPVAVRAGRVPVETSVGAARDPRLHPVHHDGVAEDLLGATIGARGRRGRIAPQPRSGGAVAVMNEQRPARGRHVTRGQRIARAREPGPVEIERVEERAHAIFVRNADPVHSPRVRGGAGGR